MNTLILSKNAHASRKSSSILFRLYPSIYIFRAASVNSGINRGLRRSKGVGFRSQGQARNGTSDGPPPATNRHSRDVPSFPRAQNTKDGWRDGVGGDSSRGDTSIASVRIRRGKKTIKPEKDATRYSSLTTKRSSTESFPRPSRDSEQSKWRRNPRDYDQPRSEYGSKSTDYSNYRPVGGNRVTQESRSQDSRPSFIFNGRDGASDYPTDHGRPRSKGDGAMTSSQRPSTTFDKRMPLSIPYTTPASEFLYGTSVVEAALSSQREPRRKLYKLYIYTGENREKADPAGLERVARRKGIEVARVGMNWLRLLDKMSAGRPHNGYILEASPLPRLPVAHLGEVTERNGERGFTVSVEHQSREEAAVNGTADFIKLPSSGRNPLVLFLDSIEDPGNLGGIIRTASFLGVTAVAYSVRNSASFTPIVLKASAGASENVTLFAVNKPAGFIADSKLSGWKIYAAVAPSKSKGPSSPPALSTDELQNPLSQDPCILMLGGEGEGLRTTLRNKADVNLSIRGRGPSHNVDSLNVSVAAGILCDAFLRRNQLNGRVTPPRVAVEPERAAQPRRDLF
jgi:21S rRNA (GM2251-2'-O)-methyltransferase